MDASRERLQLNTYFAWRTYPRGVNYPRILIKLLVNFWIFKSAKTQIFRVWKRISFLPLILSPSNEVMKRIIRFTHSPHKGFRFFACLLRSSNLNQANIFAMCISIHKNSSYTCSMIGNITSLIFFACGRLVYSYCGIGIYPLLLFFFYFASPAKYIANL